MFWTKNALDAVSLTTSSNNHDSNQVNTDLKELWRVQVVDVWWMLVQLLLTIRPNILVFKRPTQFSIIQVLGLKTSFFSSVLLRSLHWLYVS